WPSSLRVVRVWDLLPSSRRRLVRTRRLPVDRSHASSRLLRYKGHVLAHRARLTPPRTVDARRAPRPASPCPPPPAPRRSGSSRMPLLPRERATLGISTGSA